MVSFRAAFVLGAMAMLSMGNAQTRYTIDPDSVPISTRQNWCQSQIASCPLLCLQNPEINDASTSENTCDSESLDYQCICGNGFQPDAGNFSQTIPFFQCQEYGNQCVNACGSGNTPCQSSCRDNNPCGAQNPTRVNTTSSTTMPATATGKSAETGTAITTGGNTVYTGFGGDSSSPSSSSSSDKKNGSQTVYALGHTYGLAVVFAGLIGGFALLF